MDGADVGMMKAFRYIGLLIPPLGGFVAKLWIPADTSGHGEMGKRRS